MLSKTECDEAMQTADRIAKNAGRLVMEGFRTVGRIEHKSGAELVTEYDRRSEVQIRKELAAAFPDHRVVGEEGEDTGTGSLVWYVDPIDGTTNFVHGHWFFCVSIALYEGNEGLAGVVHAPALATTWRAARGVGAFRNDEPCSVSRRATLGESVCATGFPYYRATSDDDNLRELGVFIKRTRGIRRCGSAAIDLSLVADGTYDLYWEQGLNAWDVGAGAVIVREAGGKVTGYGGNSFSPEARMLVASNGLLHDTALEAIGEARHRLESKIP